MRVQGDLATNVAPSRCDDGDTRGPPTVSAKSPRATDGVLRSAIALLPDAKTRPEPSGSQNTFGKPRPVPPCARGPPNTVCAPYPASPRSLCDRSRSRYRTGATSPSCIACTPRRSTAPLPGRTARSSFLAPASSGSFSSDTLATVESGEIAQPRRVSVGSGPHVPGEGADVRSE